MSLKFQLSALLAIFTIGCTPEDCSTLDIKDMQQCYRVEIEQLRVSLSGLATNTFCETVSDCRAFEVGRKGCGGPVGFAIVGSFADPDSERTWNMNLRRTAEIHENINQAGLISDCGFNTPPKNLKCEGNYCFAEDSNQSWVNYLE